MKLTPEQLTGKSRTHLLPLPCPYSSNHFLQAQAVRAFQALQQSAVKNGFNLQPASSFRDFWRQQLIWNGKFNGERKVHDDHGTAVNLTALSSWEKCQAILRWSALPGASRHHWGTEIDFWDPDRIPENQSLQLEPWEYEQGGYFADLSAWLADNLAIFDFTLPFMQSEKSIEVGREPWHISYWPLAEQAQNQFTSELLISAWETEEIGGKDCLIEHLDEIFERYFV
ncbi:M15 family metallopeptidase [Bisgaard Taxon 10/6]|uniref:M15 family metallopeptidase n=1 Tax=Exercitatus varius TaxID=67857 RepID=UPI00294B60CB|nr:M15 family metallopeptidase [Exercitatus varius]MDG2916304.1 M15 family metallopeptidase [Exercitatus varius]MDG2956261.1 M15 family metallopeptidase [Exercitatus varius]MDG2960972.1 M15 family metallopeptidase [Exercitatus varius]MDG2961806.1 M15 family metallopeptidase [Exercitatus varius]MDG2964359.1 M15 family metallopeptidase [Exercitatus varius]